MKNKKNVFILITAFLIIIVLALIFNNINKSYRPELTNSEKTILVEKAYRNYAWGFQYRGMAIFNDGSIYEWDFEGQYTYNEFENYEKWILDNGYCIDKKVTEKDLEEIEKNIVVLKNNIERKHSGFDMGSKYIKVWNTHNEEITLKETGDYSGENISSYSQKIIRIINKYLKNKI